MASLIISRRPGGSKIGDSFEFDIIYDDFEANLEDFVYFRAFEVWSLSFNWLLAEKNKKLQAEFHWKPIDGYEPGTAFEGDVHIEGPGPMTSACRVFFVPFVPCLRLRHAQPEVAICAI